jgi:hypothetical protein
LSHLEHGAPARRLDGEVLRATMCRLLRASDDGAYLVYQLLIEAMDAARVAADRGVSQAVLTEQLRHAVQWIASVYEARAYAGEVSDPGLAGAVRARLGGTRG